MEMNAQYENFDRAQRAYDQQEPKDVVDDDESFVTNEPRLKVSGDQVEKFILEIAENGCYPDDLGRYKDAPSLYLAIAMQWKWDKERIPSVISSAYFKWAEAAAQLAEYGTPMKVPSLLREQAGMR
jgi:hypothetical protein